MNTYTKPQRKLDQMNTLADRIFEQYFAGLDYASDQGAFAKAIRAATDLSGLNGESRGATFFAAKQALSQYGEVES